MTNNSARPPFTRVEIDALKKTIAENAKKTSYPGITDGPADAYRHILGLAELRRRYGFVPAYASGIANELKPNSDNYESISDYDKIGIFSASSQMDCTTTTSA